MTLSCCQATQGARFSCHLHSRMIDCEQSRRFSSVAVPFRIAHIHSAWNTLEQTIFLRQFSSPSPQLVLEISKSKENFECEIIQRTRWSECKCASALKDICRSKENRRKISRLKQEIPSIIGPCTRRREIVLNWTVYQIAKVYHGTACSPRADDNDDLLVRTQAVLNVRPGSAWQSSGPMKQNEAKNRDTSGQSRKISFRESPGAASAIF